MTKLYSPKTTGPYTIGRAGAGRYEARNAKTGARVVFTTRQGAEGQVARWQAAARAERLQAEAEAAAPDKEQPALTKTEIVRRYRDAAQWVANVRWEDRRVHFGKAG